MDWFSLLVDYWPVAAAAVALLGGLAQREIRKAREGKNTLVTQLLVRLTYGAEHAALAVGQAYTDAIKAASADGKLTDAEKAEARRKAMAAAKAYVGKNGWAVLTKELGEEAATETLSTAVESAVKRTKGALSLGPSTPARPATKAK